MGASRVERHVAYKDSGVERIEEILVRLSAEIRELEASIAARLEGVLR